jgi:radical SAM superfamily enzyme YgiQ (UPF0313 family)
MRLAFVDFDIRFSIPLGVTGVAAMLRTHGHDVALFAADRQTSRTIDRIRSWRPDIVGFSILTGSQETAFAFARDLKAALPVPTVWGGPHPTFFPEIIELPWVDAVCRGEGEEAALEFADRLDADGGRLPTNVRNFWVKRDGEIRRNPVRPRIRSLDDLPFPARDLYYDQFPILRTHGIKHFLAHRGCPHRCAYCFNDAYNRLYREEARDSAIYHSRSPESIVEEIRQLQSRVPLKMAGFVDDVFTLDRAWTERFAQVYASRCRLPFSINARFDNLGEDTVAALAEAGLRLVYAGVESGDECIRKEIMHRRMDEVVMAEAAETCRRYGVKLITENIIGVPGETFDLALRTLQVNQRIRPDVANASLFAPYPRLPMTQYAIEHGYFDGSYDRMGTNYYHDSVLRFRSRREKNRMLNLRSFFSLLAHHPRWLRFLRPLLDLPPNAVFRQMGDLLDGYYLRKCLPFRMSTVEFLQTLLHFLRSYR